MLNISTPWTKFTKEIDLTLLNGTRDWRSQVALEGIAY
jgi:hypothetical protein